MAQTPPDLPPLQRTSRWLFATGPEGRIVIGQAPNPALWVWIVATLWRIAVQPTGPSRTLVEGIATGGLLAWALDEVFRGVNRFRRLLGFAVLIPTLVGLAARLS